MKEIRCTTIDELSNQLDSIQYTIGKRKNIEYINLPCSYDIETTSTILDDTKIATMYLFAIDINHIVYIGRDWNDFAKVMNLLRIKFSLSSKRRLIVYVHNLSYEFGFIQNRFEWVDMLALKKRKPIYAVTDTGIEFRCSLLLSGYKLEDLAKNEHLEIKKLVGDLDYSKIRHSKTPITETELQYLINDVECVVYYIEKKMKNEKTIAHIPLTKTSYIRRLMRTNCNNPKYHKLIQRLSIDSEEYRYLKVAFQGGFTHSNPFNTGKIIKNVHSFDFASSYPYVMVSEKFPMSKGMLEIEPSNEKFENLIKIYCCLIDIEFTNLEIKDIRIDFPLSGSREKTKYIDGELSNGRLIRASYARTIITEQDFLTIKDFYNYDSYKVRRMYVYTKEYLPTDFVRSLLELYKVKTELKGVLGREDEYMNAKENINSCYGMMVTDIMRDEIMFTYEEGWTVESPEEDKTISKYNKQVSRFLYYPWGVWVTAYARRNLFSAIKEIKTDYVYSDTDSVKIRNKNDHKEYFDTYNKKVIEKLEKAMEYHDLPMEMTHPKTIKGKEKWLGVWEYEGEYEAFKCMNAKRYMTFMNKDEQTGNSNWISLTVAGLNKNTSFGYILPHLGIKYTTWEDGTNKRYYLSNQLDYEKVMKFFDDGMEIPPEYTGKLASTYIDEHIKGVIKDYLGETYSFEEYSAVHLEASPYKLGMIQDFLDFIQIAQGERIGDD